jgi:hypothetical protein
MGSLTNDALYGAYQAPTLGANMMNANAQSETDWGAVLAGGIVGAAQGAIGQMVGGAYASGQLLPSPAQQAALQQQAQQRQMIMLLIVGALVYVVAKG